MDNGKPHNREPSNVRPIDPQMERLLLRALQAIADAIREPRRPPEEDE